MQLLRLARELESLLAQGGRLVRLNSERRTLFVGDVHGDLDALETVLSLSPSSVVVFLGDLVDRGPASREVLARVLEEKLERPQLVHLLMGNHEAWGLARFRPADFWESLSHEESSVVAAALLRLPLAAWHPAGILALHGALPDIAGLDEVEHLPLGGPEWRDIAWGDWTDGMSGPCGAGARPRYDAGDFEARAARLGIRVLVRSHQPDAPAYLFGDRCLTLFTSSAYGGTRRVAILPLGRHVRTARDLDLLEL